MVKVGNLDAKLGDYFMYFFIMVEVGKFLWLLSVLTIRVYQVAKCFCLLWEFLGFIFFILARRVNVVPPLRSLISNSKISLFCTSLPNNHFFSSLHSCAKCYTSANYTATILHSASLQIHPSSGLFFGGGG